MSLEPAAKRVSDRPRPLDVASAAARESRGWARLFTACALCVGVWIAMGHLADWPILVGFTICAVAARWEANTWRKDVKRTAALTRLLDSQDDTGSGPSGGFLAI